MVRKFFALDKNYLLEEAQLSLQDALLRALVEKSKTCYEFRHNPLLLPDVFSLKIRDYKPKNLKPLGSFYLSLAGIYRYKHGNNQLEFLWNGQSHLEKYQRDWTDAFTHWTDDLLHGEPFIQAVLDLTVFLPENRQAQLAENRMNFAMLDFFSRQAGFPDLKVHRKLGVLEMKVL